MATLACPACRKAMTSVDVSRTPLGTETIDYCVDCQALWFDEHESLQLTPGSTLQLFRVIAENRPGQRQPFPPLLPCPRCTSPLSLTQDLQRTTRFSYYRCARGHGRYTPFIQFLREKNFIRPLDPAELARLKQSITTIRCASCGAPVNLEASTICPYCRAPIVALDPEAIERAVRALDDAERKRLAPPDPEGLAAGILAGARMESVMAMQRSQDHIGIGVDLIGVGLYALAQVLSA
jgi:uncharacterized protein YbaR (Trm112 family)